MILFVFVIFYLKMCIRDRAEVANSLSFSLHVGADADMTNKIQVNIDAMDSASLGIKGLNVKDASGNAATYAAVSYTHLDVYKRQGLSWTVV